MYEQKLIGYDETLAALNAIREHVTRELANGTAKTSCAIAVVDTFGEPVGLMRMDGALPINVSIAVRKAKTSAIMRRDTRQQHESIQKTGWELSNFGDFAVQIPGGICITEPGANRERKPGEKGPTVYGGIGCSGRTAEGDEELAFIGLRALQKVVWGRSD